MRKLDRDSVLFLRVEAVSSDWIVLAVCHMTQGGRRECRGRCVICQDFFFLLSHSGSLSCAIYLGPHGYEEFHPLFCFVPLFFLLRYSWTAVSVFYVT
jgi:hypothetical protein